MENKKQKKLTKEISIPLFIPLLIIIISIIVFVNVSNANSTVIATTNQGVAETNSQNELETEEIVEIEEEILPTSANEVVEEVIEPTTSIETPSTTPKTVTHTASKGKEYTSVGILNIPSLNIEYPILSETSTQLLKVSLTKYWGANPNEVGNMVVLGHNYKNNKFFGNLSKIQHGEIIKITDLTGKTLDYKVYDTYVIEPDDNACTSQLTNGKAEITLITCHYENGSAHATKRFVVKAKADFA